MEISTFGERLRAERKRLGLTQEALAAVGGVKKLAQINYEKGATAPDAAYLAAVSERGVDVLFLIAGHINEAQLSDDETEMLAGYRALDVRGKAGVLALIGGMKSDAPSAVFHGGVGQVIQGDQRTKSVSFTVGDSNKKGS